MAKYKLPKVEELLKSGVHFGHQVRRWNPKMEEYIFAHKSGIHIIDLDVTHKNLDEACEKLHDVAAEGGQIVFVGTKRQAAEIIENEAKRSGALFVNQRWLGGTITNFDIMKKNMDKLVDLKKKREAGELDKYTKKERLLIDRKIDKLEASVGGLVGLQGTPKALFLIDIKREKTAAAEARRVGIPVIGLIDTNADPDLVDFVIPGNDDAIRSIATIVKVVADAVESGYKTYEKKLAGKKEEEAKAKEEKKEEKKPAKKKVAKKETK